MLLTNASTGERGEDEGKDENKAMRKNLKR